MRDKSKAKDGLVETGKPNDPAKKENPDTRLDQQQPGDDRKPTRDDKDPALETTRIAGQGSS